MLYIVAWGKSGRTKWKSQIWFFWSFEIWNGRWKLIKVKVELFLFWSSPPLSRSPPWCVRSQFYLWYPFQQLFSKKSPICPFEWHRCPDKRQQHNEVFPPSATLPLFSIASLSARFSKYFHAFIHICLLRCTPASKVFSVYFIVSNINI